MTNEYLKRRITFIEENLRKYFNIGGFEKLDRAMEYSLFSNGKRLRPLIMLETAKVLGCEDNDVLPFAMAIEMVHTYSLIHDDLPAMDDDSLRRGKLTNHKIFGEANAILAGDGLLNLAMETALLGIKNEKTLKAAQLLFEASGRKGMISGQAADLYFEKRQATEGDLQYIHLNKTGALLRVAFEIPAIISGNNSNIELTMRKIGEKFGIVFQYTDDLLDKYGNEKVLGKSIGKDEAQFKSTALHVLGEKRTRERIESLTKEIISDLSSLKIEMKFFNWLVDLVVNRDN